MTFLQKHLKEILLAIVILAIYFLTRLIFLTNIPIFTDEAIYIRWAQISLHDASWRFISLTDGKQPFQTWVMMGFLKVISDPLIAGRLVSVTAGFFSMIGLWFLSFALFKNKTVSFLTLLLYIFYPLALLHDRLAIEDSLSAMWYIWSLYFSLLLIRRQNIAAAYTLGFVLGGGVLTKSIGLISMALLPFFLIFFDFKQKNYRYKLFKVIGLGVISVVIGFIMFGILRLSPLYGMIATKNNTFVFPLHDWLQQTIAFRYSLFSGNLIRLLSFFVGYFNVTYIVFLIVGLLIGLYRKEKTILIMYFAAPFLFDAAFGKVLFPRYILFMTDVLLPIVAYGIWQASMIVFQKHKKFMQSGLLIFSFIALLPTMYVSIFLLINPLKAPIPDTDHFQYIADWPAGWGITNAITYLRQNSTSSHIFVGTEGNFGLMPYGFEMYFYNDKNITTKWYWPISQTIPADLLAEAKQMPTYIYFYEPCVNCPATGVAPVGWPVTPVLTVSVSRAHATLYKVNAQ